MIEVQTAAVFEQTERPPRRMEVALYGIYEISKILCGPGDLHSILTTTLGVLKSFLDMGNGLIALLDAEGGVDMLVAASPDTEAKRYYESLPEKALGQIVVTEIPLAVNNVALDSAFAWETSAWGQQGQNFSFLGVPIKDRDRVVGTLTIDRTWTVRPSAHLDDDVRFLKMVANLIGQTVRLHRLVTRDRERMLEDQNRLAKEREGADAGSARARRSVGIIGESRSIQAVLDKLRLVARRDSTVLLQGESGTGKELFANALHDLSPRRGGPFIKLNCAALPESVLESELFGHEKGAFTGAIVQRKGRFELAHGGTLFLDEIGEISPAFQANLLRVLQEGEFERVGGSRTLKVNVRLVTATNRNLEDAVAKGTFRADLYYRINVVPIYLPPLRDRREDIPLLANEFLRRFNADNDTRLSLSPSALAVLAQCYFPGNIRELENCIRRTATLSHGEKLIDRDFACRNDGCLSSVLWKTQPGAQPCQAQGCSAPAPVDREPRPAPRTDGSAMAELHRAGKTEHESLIEAMEKCGWVQAKAARLLGLTPRQIGYAVRKYGIEIPKF